MIEIGGRDVSRLPPAARDFGIVFQSYALFPNLTVAANVGYGLVNRRRPGAEIKARVKELLDAGRACRSGNQISGPAVRRPAAARRACARAGDVARTAAARRAALRARCARAAAPARRDQGAAAPARRHHHHGDARPGRSACDGRPHRGDEPGRDRAGRHAAEIYRQPDDRLRRRFRRQHDVSSMPRSTAPKACASVASICRAKTRKNS